MRSGTMIFRCWDSVPDFALVPKKKVRLFCEERVTLAPVLAPVVSAGAIMETMESLEATADDAPHEDDDDEPYH